MSVVGVRCFNLVLSFMVFEWSWLVRKIKFAKRFRIAPASSKSMFISSFPIGCQFWTFCDIYMFGYVCCGFAFFFNFISKFMVSSGSGLLDKVREKISNCTGFIETHVYIFVLHWVSVLDVL